MPDAQGRMRLGTSAKLVAKPMDNRMDNVMDIMRG